MLWTDGKVDFTLVGCILGGAFFGGSIFFAISFTFILCARAGLNIGIAQTIWGFTPFFASILDYIIFKNRLETYHIAGIVCMLSAASFISLSNLFEAASINADP